MVSHRRDGSLSVTNELMSAFEMRLHLIWIAAGAKIKVEALHAFHNLPINLLSAPIAVCHFLAGSFSIRDTAAFASAGFQNGSFKEKYPIWRVAMKLFLISNKIIVVFVCIGQHTATILLPQSHMLVYCGIISQLSPQGHGYNIA